MDAKLIAASNVAVAQAIIEFRHSTQDGTPAIPTEKQAMNAIRYALRQIEDLSAAKT